MNLAAKQQVISIDEYLEGELISDVRHEYLAGEVYAMAGAGEKHNRISLNIAFHLRAASRGKACGVFIHDMKLRMDASDSFYYPDVLVTCDPADTQSLFKKMPCLLVEVLSPSTEAIDRREKLLAYRKLPSLRHYLLVSQEQRSVQWHQRDEAGQWLISDLEGSGTLVLDCPAMAVTVTLDDIYEDVNLG
jgi:Uma2 family endonuclease